MNFVPHLLGYDKFEIDDEYEEIYVGDEYIYKPGGLWINIDVDEARDTFHFLSKDKLHNIVSDHRIGTINSLYDIDKEGKIFDWKVGDFVFFEFKLGYIQEMYNDNIRTVNDGYGGSTGWRLNDRVFKISPYVIRISEEFSFWWNNYIDDLELKNDNNDFRLNTALLHDILVELWIECINTKDESGKIKFIEDLSNNIKNEKFDLTWNGEEIFRKNKISEIK